MLIPCTLDALLLPLVFDYAAKPLTVVWSLILLLALSNGCPRVFCKMPSRQPNAYAN